MQLMRFLIENMRNQARISIMINQMQSSGSNYEFEDLPGSFYLKIQWCKGQDHKYLVLKT